MAALRPNELPRPEIQNTMTGKRAPLQVREPGKVSFYSCGPTVYGHIHIGNLRAALVSDLFFRYFKHLGYDVNFVRNYTDVDDKIIETAQKAGMTAEALAQKFTVEVEKDYALAGMLEPTHKTKVTEHIPEIISLIEKIIKNGKGYVTPGGEVFFSIDAFPEYGKLSGKKLDDLEAGHRVEVRDGKKNPFDFSLWKPAKPGEPFWESPWGKGRPGWHIECSAMATKWLGPQMDLHHGGEDLVFPHHENEIAQSEAATGVAPYVGCWVHNGFLTLSKAKMSKSLGNVVSARDFLSLYGGEIARYLLLSVHYRTLLDFSDETFDSAISSLQRLYEAKQKAQSLTQLKAAMPDQRAESMWGQFAADAAETRKEVVTAFSQDLNTAGALGAFFKLVREFNRILAEPKASGTPSAILGAQLLLAILEEEIGSVIGVGRLLPEKALKDLDDVRRQRGANSGKTQLSADQIEAMIQARLEARKAKDFKESDRIRDELAASGVVIKDGPQGTKWEYK